MCALSSSSVNALRGIRDDVGLSSRLDISAEIRVLARNCLFVFSDRGFILNPKVLFVLELALGILAWILIPLRTILGLPCAVRARWTALLHEEEPRGLSV